MGWKVECWHFVLHPIRDDAGDDEGREGGGDEGGIQRHDDENSRQSSCSLLEMVGCFVFKVFFESFVQFFFFFFQRWTWCPPTFSTLF
jgi:hypothetical protein